MENPKLEAVKELLRVLVLAVLPVLISSLEAGEVDWRAVIVIASLASLRAIDKWMHLSGKEDDDAALTKGLTQF